MERPVVRILLAACGGFLAAVLWMDLMFDVQALGSVPVPVAAVSSIAAYYRRVTTDADPMSKLIGVVMLTVVLGAAWDVARRGRRALDWLALVLVGLPIVLAATRVLPNAVQLGSGIGALDERSALTRAILRDHLLCFSAIIGFVVTQMLSARRSNTSGDRHRSTPEGPPA